VALFGPTVLRLAVGAVFVAHGAQKLFGFPIDEVVMWGGGGLTGTAAFFAQLGLEPAFPLAIFVGLVELAGGLLLVAGAFTLVASVLLTVNMLVAVWTVHLASGFFLNWTMAGGAGHGYEFNLALIGALVSLMLTGPGALSFDRHRARAAETQAFGRARVRSGQA
jgi:putative oxidoreductase